MFRVVTNSSGIDVTKDHSLVDKDLQEIKPKDAKFGTELFHLYYVKNKIKEEEFIVQWNSLTTFWT